MPRLKSPAIAVLIGAVVVLSVACAPRSARLSASGGAPARCNGAAVLEVQNDLGATIQIFEVPRSKGQPPVPLAVVGRGWHTLEVSQADRRRYFARTVGQSPFTSYAVGSNNDPDVRMMVRCRPTS